MPADRTSMRNLSGPSRLILFRGHLEDRDIIGAWMQTDWQRETIADHDLPPIQVASPIRARSIKGRQTPVPAPEIE